MMPNDAREDAVVRALARLAGHDVGAARAERIRARCHAALARRRRAPKLSAFLGSAFVARVLEPALVGGVAILFLTEVIERALSLYGL